MAMMQKLGATGRLLRSSPSQLTRSRGFAADAHGPARIPMWADPMSPSKWKEEHFVFVSLAGWGTLFYGGYKFFTSGSKGAPGKAVAEPQPEGTEKVKVEKH